MSDIIILNKSYNTKKKTKIYTENEGLVIEEDTGKSKRIEAKDISKINLLYAKCPGPFLRNVPIVVEGFTVLFIILAVLFRKNMTLVIVFSILALVMVFIAALVGKIIYKYSPEALELIVVCANKKNRVIAYKSNEVTFNKLQRVVNDMKKSNDTIILDVNRSKKY